MKFSADLVALKFKVGARLKVDIPLSFQSSMLLNILARLGEQCE